MKIRWTAFEGRQFQAKGSGLPRVSLDRRGVFYLNQAAWEALGSPGAVELQVDDSGRIFGLKPTDPRRANAFKVRQRADGRHRRISGAAFFQHLRLKLDRTMLFQNIDIDDEGVLVLDMNTSVNVARGAR